MVSTRYGHFDREDDTMRTMTIDPRPLWRDYFLSIAATVATRADCTRRRVGCVLVVDNRIIATGYNGAASGQPGCLSSGACPRGRMSTSEVPPLGDYDRPGTSSFCIAVHAEVNALLHATLAPRGAVAYITDPPCPGCRKALAAAGIAKVIWTTGEMDGADLTNFEVSP